MWERISGKNRLLVVDSYGLAQIILWLSSDNPKRRRFTPRWSRGGVPFLSRFCYRPKQTQRKTPPCVHRRSLRWCHFWDTDARPALGVGHFSRRMCQIQYRLSPWQIQSLHPESCSHRPIFPLPPQRFPSLPTAFAFWEALSDRKISSIPFSSPPSRTTYPSCPPSLSCQTIKQLS